MSAKTEENAGRRAWHIFARVFAAVVLGYLVANTGSVLLGFLLPLPKVDSVLTASLLSFAIYTAVIMWIFSVKTLRKMWLGLCLALVVTSVGAWLLYLLETAA